jgi:hypothetical protein
MNVRVHGLRVTVVQQGTRCSSIKADPAVRGPEATPEAASVCRAPTRATRLADASVRRH